MTTLDHAEAYRGAAILLSGEAPTGEEVRYLTELVARLRVASSPANREPEEEELLEVVNRLDARREVRRREAHVRAMTEILDSEFEARTRVLRYKNEGGPYGEIERLTRDNLRLWQRCQSAEASIEALMNGGTT